MAGRLTLGPRRLWGSVVATLESPKEPAQLPGLIKPASCKPQTNIIPGLVFGGQVNANFNTTAKYRKVAGEEHRKWYDRLWNDTANTM